jgi:hypothetical protein
MKFHTQINTPYNLIVYNLHASGVRQQWYRTHRTILLFSLVFFLFFPLFINFVRGVILLRITLSAQQSSCGFVI